MERIKEIFIKDFRCLKYFSFELQPKEKLNMNILVGKNGSGKSTILDALYEIASKYPNTTSKMAFYIKNPNNEIVLGNRTQDDLKTPALPKETKQIWNNVLRFYTGNSLRGFEFNNLDSKNGFSFQSNDLKWILSAIFLSGAWKNPANEYILEKMKSLVFSQYDFVPQNIYIDINDDIDNNHIKALMGNCDDTDKISDKETRYIFNLNNIVYKKDCSFSLLEAFINEENVKDTGFWYKKVKKTEQNEETKSKEIQLRNFDLLHCETLSDGELGLIRRFSMILLMKELKGEENRSLLLLDEPETHFNENWKRHFIYLIEEALKDTCHDVFIATHSAMLITDVKRDELYHFELVDDKIKTFPVCLNTYATNIVDIGQALFDLEADIGERSKNDIQAALKGVEKICNEKKDEVKIELQTQKERLWELLKQVGPGEWRWRIRAKLNQLDSLKEKDNV